MHVLFKKESYIQHVNNFTMCFPHGCTCGAGVEKIAVSDDRTQEHMDTKKTRLAWEFRVLVPRHIAAFCQSSQEVQRTEEADFVKEVTAAVSK